MKTFSKPLYLLLSFLFISTFTGCSDEETNKPNKEDSPKITQFEQGDFICKNEGGVYTISFSTNTDWKSSINADWCNIEPTNGGAGKHNIMLIVSENTNNEDREAVVKIECGTDFRTFKVSQKREQVIIASPESITVGYSGEIVEINVQSNIDYSLTLQDDWISIAPETKSAPLNSTTWRFNIAENNTPYSRRSKIVFAGNEKSSEVSIYQTAKRVPEKYDFEVDGLFYRIISISDLTVELVGGYGVYSGVIGIPDEVEYCSKTFKIIKIDKDCFANSSVTKVTIGKNIVAIGEDAFSRSSISYIEIPKNVKEIENYAFGNCENLSEVVIVDGDAVLNFPDQGSVWGNCPIKQLYIGRDLDYFPDFPFNNLSVAEKITIGPNVTGLADGFDQATKVTEFVIPAGVIYINCSFFLWESLKKVIFEDGEKDLIFNNSSLFQSSPVEYVYIGRNLKRGKTVLNNPFSDKSDLPITTLEIGSSVSTLPDFRNLKKLEKITIPASVREIGYWSGCSNLRSITCEGITPPLAKDWDSYFDNTVYANCILFVPIESVATYQSANVWKNFFNIQPIANQ